MGDSSGIGNGFSDFDLFLPSMERVVDANGVFLEDDADNGMNSDSGESPSYSSSAAVTATSAQTRKMNSLPSFSNDELSFLMNNSGSSAAASSSAFSSSDYNGADSAIKPKAKRQYTKRANNGKGNNGDTKIETVAMNIAAVAGSSADSADMNAELFAPKKYAVPITITATNTANSKKKNALGFEVSLASSPNGTGSSDEDDGNEDDEKKNKRRQQIAAASRASRARRKRELEDLREENRRLREERSQFLSKIGDLQMKVEALRERGSTDMRIENELLRAQLEEHKRFVSCFKRLCDGAPTSLNARHMIYKQGSDAAQAHVLSLISQSQADDWQEAIAPDGLNIPYQNFCMYYKFKTEYGEPEVGTPGSASGAEANASSQSGKSRKRLHVRVDVLFPATDAMQISEFFWNSFASTDVQNRLYGVKGVELTQLADDMPDKDTKMIYYREKHAPPKRDVDWAIICNRRKRDLAKSTLAPPNKKGAKPQLGRASTVVIAMSTTQHSVAPQFDNADRITSLFVQGCVTWNVGGDCRACIVFSFPEDFKIRALEGFSDVIDENGVVAKKFLLLLRGFNELLGEHAANYSSSNAMPL